MEVRFMSYLALYRKYRPSDFDSVYGQEEVVTVIRNAILNNKISHAYLFSGPRGTGKTTIAKIIAKLVNCEHLENGKPCGKCYNCLNFSNSNDIVEIDAASNNGVDEIREIRDKINLVPSNAKFKVYIVDEVHMLTNQAFNALLKTLEEPPSHVIFILATTEPYKIPLTIASRCQKFRFSKIDDNKVVDRLKEISKLENISCDDDAYYEIARLSDGCMRDAINLLDQLVAYSDSHITLEDIYKVNGSVSYNDINELLNFIYNNDKTKIIEFVDNFDKSGKEINKFIEELIIYIKDIILYKNAGFLSNIKVKNENIKVISDAFSDKILYMLVDMLNSTQNSVKTSSHGSILFMTSILNFAGKINVQEHYCDSIKQENSVVNKNEITSNGVNMANKIISREIILDEKIVDSSNISELKIDLDGRINNTLAGASKDILKIFKSKWSLISDYLFDEKFSSVCGLLKDSNVVVSSSEYIIISNKLSSVASRINYNSEIIEELIEKIFDSKVKVVAVSDEEWSKIKSEYINNIKNGKKYVILELNEKVENEKEKTPMDDLIDLVGENVIEYK